MGTIAGCDNAAAAAAAGIGGSIGAAAAAAAAVMVLPGRSILYFDAGVSAGAGAGAGASVVAPGRSILYFGAASTAAAAAAAVAVAGRCGATPLPIAGGDNGIIVAGAITAAAPGTVAIGGTTDVVTAAPAEVGLLPPPPAGTSSWMSRLTPVDQAATSDVCRCARVRCTPFAFFGCAHECSVIQNHSR